MHVIRYSVEEKGRHGRKKVKKFSRKGWIYQAVDCATKCLENIRNIQ